MERPLRIPSLKIVKISAKYASLQDILGLCEELKIIFNS